MQATQNQLSPNMMDTDQSTQLAANNHAAMPMQATDPGMLQQPHMMQGQQPIDGTAVQPPATHWRQNPVLRQLVVMVGIALSVAIGVAVVLWSQTPNYSLLFGSLDSKDVAEVVQLLDQVQIPYRIDEASGALMVASSQVREARMQLATSGFPRSDGVGYELLDKETGFGTSRTIEAARFQRALEGELARTIQQISSIDVARVHIAKPKQSVFVRDRKAASASVSLKLRKGRILEKAQIAAIVHLVASSIPELETSHVTVVDQRGNLLSNMMDSPEMMLSATQFEYTQKMEKHYQRRIENILSPILGEQAITAQVTAQVDFTVTEQTQETFNPDQPAVRSEQINEQNSSLGDIQGVPGALTNQPPAAGKAPEVAGGGATGDGGKTTNSSRRSTRNFELDRTMSHIRKSPVRLHRLSVAVVVDDLLVRKEVPLAAGDTAEEGQTTKIVISRVPRSPEDIERITQLVKDAIGFNVQRGDSVSVINASYQPALEIEALPEVPLWEQPWFWDAVKQVVGVLIVLLLILVVLRPAMKRLSTPVEVQKIQEEAELAAKKLEDLTPEERAKLEAEGKLPSASGEDGEEGEAEGDEGKDDVLKLTGPMSYEQLLESAREVIREDPKRVAQMLKSWVAEE